MFVHTMNQATRTKSFSYRESLSPSNSCSFNCFEAECDEHPGIGISRGGLKLCCNEINRRFVTSFSPPKKHALAEHIVIANMAFGDQ